LYGAHEEDLLTGPPGQILGQRNGAICLGTSDGAIWISHLKAKPVESGVVGIKLPAAQVLGDQLAGVPTLDLPVDDTTDYRTFREIRYVEDADVGYLSFDFYNGAMSTDQCTRLRTAFVLARLRSTKVICLTGGRDYWSNGIHLNVIQASADPALESWRNIQAMNDLILEILDTPSHLMVAALRGNAGAGGAMLAIAADQVFARSGIVINPHYRSMGNLYGSEYWTYTLPRRVGVEKALELTEACEPMGTGPAQEIGFIDAAFGPDLAAFQREVTARVRRLAQRRDYATIVAWKQQLRAADEAAKPLANYRAEELTRMWGNFFGSDASYHHARRQFVLKSTPAAPVELQSRRRGLSPEIAA
jgi:putative two-component system protein, hydrogenase maturation factor HypX/HoxX